MNQYNYSTFRDIEDYSRLAMMFNGIMHRLNHLRMLCAPESFRKDESIADFQDTKFCDFCRYELWMHGVIDRLNRWQELLCDYFVEYGGSWQYYAASNRLAFITEYGGDEKDYEADGETIRKDGLKDEEYMLYTIVHDIYSEDRRDIVQDTLPSDLNGLCSDLVANSQIDMLAGLRKFFGKNLQAYRKDADGEMKPLSQEQHDLDMVSNQVDAEDDSKRLMAIIGCLHGMFQIIRSCKYNDDNTEMLKMVQDASAGLLALDWEVMENVMKKYSDKYVKE